MATSYGGTPPGITGTHYGGSRLGTPGAQVPSEGANGPGYLYAGLSLPADAAVEVRGPITRWPAGTLTVYEDSSFSYVGATDYALYQLYQDGVASTVDIGYGAGIGRIELSVGAAGATLSGNAVLGAIEASGSLFGAAGPFSRPPRDVVVPGRPQQISLRLSALRRQLGRILKPNR